MLGCNEFGVRPSAANPTAGKPWHRKGIGHGESRRRSSPRAVSRLTELRPSRVPVQSPPSAAPRSAVLARSSPQLAQDRPAGPIANRRLRLKDVRGRPRRCRDSRWLRDLDVLHLYILVAQHDRQTSTVNHLLHLTMSVAMILMAWRVGMNLPTVGPMIFFLLADAVPRLQRRARPATVA
jgi:Domain of unknown function (DUF5134)